MNWRFSDIQVRIHRFLTKSNKKQVSWSNFVQLYLLEHAEDSGTQSKPINEQLIETFLDVLRQQPGPWEWWSNIHALDSDDLWHPETTFRPLTVMTLTSRPLTVMTLTSRPLTVMTLTSRNNVQALDSDDLWPPETTFRLLTVMTLTSRDNV